MANIGILCLMEFVSLTSGFIQLDRSEMDLINITDLQESLPSPIIRQGVTMLNISHNYLIELSGNWDLPNLTYLDAASNEIAQIGVDYFCYYPHLTTLDLSSNQFTKVPVPCKAPASSILDLDLSYNRIEYISADSFDNYIALQNLSLAGNNLTELGSLMALKDSLVRLDLTTMMLTDLIGLNLSEFQNLRHLTLEDNALTELYLCGLGGVLSELNLAHNRFASIPDLSCLGPILKELEMQWNLLSKVSDQDFENLAVLQYLDVGHNVLASLDLCSGSALNGLNESLEELDASHNQLSSTSFIVGCSNVYALNLAGNPLSKWPGVESMTSLETLDVSNTQLAKAPSGSVRDRLVRVSELILQNNKLLWCDISIIIEMSNGVTMMDLSGNSVQTVRTNHLCESSLEKLILANNSITCLPEVGANWCIGDIFL